jgi:hypothetical protein
MATNNNLGSMAIERANHLACAIIDSLFLGLWAIPNVGLHYLAPYLAKLTGVDSVVLYCLQVLFAIATLAPVGIWIYKDVRIMLIRANKDLVATKTTTARPSAN